MILRVKFQFRSQQANVYTPGGTSKIYSVKSLGIHYNRGFDLLDFVKNKEIFQYKDSYVQLPKGPGLGIDMDEDKIKEVAQEGLVWSNPSWKNYDGTIAEW